MLWANPEGNANLGVSVLAEGAASIARRAFGENIAVTYQEFGSASDGPGLTRRMFLTDILKLGRGPISSRLSGFDVILDTGAGDSFTDHYGLARLSQIVYAQRAAKRVGRPLVLMPQTIGPFNSTAGRFLARLGAQKAEAVFTRDPASVEAANQLGIAAQAGFTDVVFALPQPRETSRDHDVLINVSGLLGGINAHVDSRLYMEAMRKLIRGLLAVGRRVTLLAHVVGPEVDSGHWGDNDVPAVRQLAREFAGQVDLEIPEHLSEVRSVVSGANLVVGSRMHACLNALSVGTPAIAMAYSRKFAPLMNDLGWRYSVDLRSTTDAAEDVLRIIRETSMETMQIELALVRDAANQRTDAMVSALKGVVNAR